MSVYLAWFDYQRRGSSSRAIAKMTGNPVSSVKAGLKKARAFLADHGRFQHGTYVPPLEPIFGCGAWPAPDGEPCSVCGGDVRSDAVVCGQCHAVSPINQRKLNAQRNRADVDESASRINFEQTRPAQAAHAKTA